MNRDQFYEYLSAILEDAFKAAVAPDCDHEWLRDDMASRILETVESNPELSK